MYKKIIAFINNFSVLKKEMYCYIIFRPKEGKLVIDGFVILNLVLTTVLPQKQDRLEFGY
jgi:hypothetical protein